MSLAVKQFNVVKKILNKSIFDENIIHMILKYYWKLLDNKRKILLNWINIEELYWYHISKNPNAIDLLKIRIEYENSLSSEDYNNLRNKINWEELSKNPNAIELLTNNQDKINWRWLCINPNAIKLLKLRIEYENLLDYDDCFISEICWKGLSENLNAIELLKIRIEYENLLDYDDYFEHKIDWKRLSKNPNAINLLKENQDKIDWYKLSTNPSIFEDEPMPLI